MKVKRILIFICLVVGAVSGSKAQTVVLKSNLLYDATATMNLGLEFGLSRK